MILTHPPSRAGSRVGEERKARAVSICEWSVSHFSSLSSETLVHVSESQLGLGYGEWTSVLRWHPV